VIAILMLLQLRRHTLLRSGSHLHPACALSWRPISTKEVDNVTKKIFSSQHNPAELQLHLTTNISTMDSTNISNIIYLSGKQGVKLNSSQLGLMSSRLKQKQMKLNKMIVSKILYGFLTQSDEEASVREFLHVLTQKLIGSNRLILDGQGVGNSLYGLQRMTSQSTEVQALLSELRHHVEHCARELKSQELGNALYGLQNMSSDSKEVRGLLVSLANRVQKCPEEFNAQAIGSSLFGLQNMDSSHLEVCLEWNSRRKLT
jgi:hypothetical protein